MSTHFWLSQWGSGVLLAASSGDAASRPSAQHSPLHTAQIYPAQISTMPWWKKPGLKKTFPKYTCLTIPLLFKCFCHPDRLKREG